MSYKSTNKIYSISLIELDNYRLQLMCLVENEN